MPKDKDLKRLVRSRMEKTGESYTTARAQLRKKKDAPPAAPAADLAALAGMSDEAVHAKTGRTWAEWVRVLDAADAASLPHREIARRVREEHGTPSWWTQAVTVGYERIKGLREIGQQRSGTFAATKSKTLPVPVARLYAAFSAARTRRRWLSGVEFMVRGTTPEKSMRLTWEDGTSVDLRFAAKGEGKSQVAVEHTGLATRGAAEKMKAFWGERLAALAEILE